jgi:hypothetical protein
MPSVEEVLQKLKAKARPYQLESDTAQQRFGDIPQGTTL